MKEVLKKSITFIVCVCMILSALPVGVLAQTDDVQTDVRNDISTQATSAFGGMLTDAIDTQEIDADSPYFISDLIFDGNNATASYYNEAVCTLVVAIYDEEIDQMLDSAVTSVEAESLEATVSFSSLPENFVAKAFLLDENNASLCKPYTCNENTTAYKEFISKTTEDFDEDRVINLDESTTNNFIVLTDDTIIVNGNDVTNMLESADVENDEYIFSNIDEQIKNLRVGDMFYLDNGDEENITVIKIASVSVEGDKAVIIADNTTLAEAFEYVKIDTEAQTDDMGYDGANADEGVTYLGKVDYETGEPIAPDGSEISTNAIEIDDTKPYSDLFKYEYGDVTATVIFRADVTLKAHIGLDYGEVLFTVSPSAKLAVEVENEVNEEINFGKLPVVGIKGAAIYIEPTIVFEFSGKLTVTGELTFTLGFGWNSNSGFVNKCKKPSFKPMVKVEVTFFIGFDLNPQFVLIHENVASARLSGLVGAEIEALLTTELEEGHSCVSCLDGVVNGKVDISVTLSVVKTMPFGGEYPKDLYSKTDKIADFYFSVGHVSFGWGECPYKGEGSSGSGSSGDSGETGGDLGEVVAPPGYIFAGYDENGNPIFVADAKVQYAVDIYKMRPDGEYEEYARSIRYGTTDSVVVIFPDDVIIPEGYWVNTEKSVLEATVRGDGSTVLSVYLDRLTGLEKVGDKVFLGTYPQTQRSNGKFKVEPIEWRVLENNNGELLLLSEKVLDAQPYHSKYENIIWADCSLRIWLNDNFYNTAFTEREKALISTTYLENKDNPLNGTEGGDDTQDKIFILSYSDSINGDYGFSTSTDNSNTRVAVYSDYADYLAEFTYYMYNTAVWWLRTPGIGGNHMCHVNDIGFVSSEGYSVNYDKIGVRPALRINLNSTASSSLGTQSVSYAVDNGVDTLGFSYDKCIADNTYTLLNVTDYGESFKLRSENLYYINTVSADESGAVTASFIPKANAENSTILLVGDFGNGTETVVVDEWYNEYTVTWNTDGETVTQTVIEGAEIIAPENPEKVGYTFTGWTPSIPDTMSDYDLTFTATWAVNSYDAVFNANGGSWADGATEMTVSTEYGAEIIAPEIPAKQGYIFSKWSPEIGVMDSIDGKTFTAEWIPATDTRYTVETYTMNTAGEYEKTVQTLGGTTGETVSTNPEIKTGFTLNSEKSVLSGTVVADNSLVLKVFIDRNTYTFATVIDGVSAETKYYYGSTISEPASPTKEGYKFMGWDREIPSAMPAENILVTAIFEKSYICPDCGEEILGEDAINEHIAGETNVTISGGTVISGELKPYATITVKAEQVNGKVFSHWVVEGATVADANSPETTIVLGSGEIIITAEYDDCECKCHQGGIIGFFYKIILFFQKLFGNNLVCFCGAKH